MADAKPDKVVRIAPDRWQWLVAYIAENCGDKHPGEEIAIRESTEVHGILFLPALYRSM